MVFQVYGFSSAISAELRDFNNQNGLMRTITLPRVQGELLPLADRDFMDCRRDPREHNIGCFLAGDIRANEQVALLAMHTVWLREHNRVALQLRAVNPLWESDTIFHEARKVKITPKKLLLRILRLFRASLLNPNKFRIFPSVFLFFFFLENSIHVLKIPPGT
jgi:Animal haem peroxidase